MSLLRNKIARKEKNCRSEVLFQIAVYLNIYFKLRYIRIFLKLGTQFVFVLKKMRDYYKLQRNNALTQNV